MKLQSIFKAPAGYLEYVGIAAVLFMLLVTGIDVIGGNVFNKPIRGASEMVSVAQVVAISTVIPINFYVNKHINIEFVVRKMSYFSRVLTEKIISIICLLFFIILTWQSIRHGIALYRAGEISSSAHLPLFVFPFFLSIGAAVAALYFIAELHKKEETVFYVQENLNKKGVKDDTR